jgi:hypothetical protein
MSALHFLQILEVNLFEKKAVLKLVKVALKQADNHENGQQFSVKVQNFQKNVNPPKFSPMSAEN